MAKTGLTGVILLAMGLTTCTQGGNLCSLGPFITDPGASERWTRAEKEELVARNNAGTQICGWNAPKGGKSS